MRLADEYRNPKLADGDWTVTTVMAGTAKKSVLDKHGQAPPGLVRIQRLIDATASGVTWLAR